MVEGGGREAPNHACVRGSIGAGTGMAHDVPGGFAVLVEGVPGPAVLCRLRDMFGPQHIAQRADGLQLTLTDQAAMIGALRQLHDLGISIALVERRPQTAASSPER
jgi:hypothetical protein